jgi:ABC-type polysaccharide/polyol phosphate export permease
VNLLFTAGVALLLAMANLFFRDVKYLFEALITVWMFASAVVYPIDTMQGRLGGLLAVNPMTQIIEAYRQVLLYGRAPEFGGFGVAAAASAVILVASWYGFHKAEFAFAENI